ncbi:hypothetical protein DERP_002322 [Dermatophagoides pteronyssinus]|uniref:Uncharacterized protein n=1 Tax=Dermatophagoides pteronyssinus TaxID=6956 RepID=A0ABQ8JHD7_DERPT|nr:hypothetical protein DERP_002322 [Dermatophagoides pteronyssinus]
MAHTTSIRIDVSCECSKRFCNTGNMVANTVPEAMLVSAHAASNCNVGKLLYFNASIKVGKIPAAIISSIGGFLSDDNNIRAVLMAISFLSGSGLMAAITKEFKSSSANFGSITPST